MDPICLKMRPDWPAATEISYMITAVGQQNALWFQDDAKIHSSFEFMGLLGCIFPPKSYMICLLVLYCLAVLCCLTKSGIIMFFGDFRPSEVLCASVGDDSGGALQLQDVLITADMVIITLRR